MIFADQASSSAKRWLKLTPTILWQKNMTETENVWHGMSQYHMWWLESFLVLLFNLGRFNFIKSKMTQILYWSSENSKSKLISSPPPQNIVQCIFHVCLVCVDRNFRLKNCHITATQLNVSNKYSIVCAP